MAVRERQDKRALAIDFLETPAERPLRQLHLDLAAQLVCALEPRLPRGCKCAAALPLCKTIQHTDGETLEQRRGRYTKALVRQISHGVSHVCRMMRAVDADARDDSLLRSCNRTFDENADELLSVEQHVVRPFQPQACRIECRNRIPNSIMNRECRDETDLRRKRRRRGIVEQERRIEIARFGNPVASAASPSRDLFFRDDPLLRRAGSRTRKRFGIGRADFREMSYGKSACDSRKSRHLRTATSQPRWLPRPAVPDRRRTGL